MYDALILAGGAGRRLGGVDKPAVDVRGRTLLEHVVAAVPDAARVVIVGRQREVGTDRRLIWCLEDPPGGGPVAGIAAGLAGIAADVVLVLAADLPSVAPAVPVLRAALATADRAVDVAMLVDDAGRRNHLAAAWRRDALCRVVTGSGPPAGSSMRSLTTSAVVIDVPDPHGWGRDCDTWADIDAARAGSSARDGLGE